MCPAFLSILEQLFSLPSADKCGGNVRISTANYLTSPGYPTSYPPSQRCAWVISAPGPHQRILINFNPHFDLEDRECKWVPPPVWALVYEKQMCFLVPKKPKLIQADFVWSEVNIKWERVKPLWKQSLYYFSLQKWTNDIIVSVKINFLRNFSSGLIGPHTLLCETTLWYMFIYV